MGSAISWQVGLGCYGKVAEHEEWGKPVRIFTLPALNFGLNCD